MALRRREERPPRRHGLAIGDAYPSDLPGWGRLAGKYFPEDLVAASYQVVSIIRHKTNLGSDFAPRSRKLDPFILYTHIL